MAEGDLERAAALSERALRISPRDAYLWYRLANIRYVQRQYSEAEGFARRALSFAGNDSALTQQINQLLSQLGSANG
jgi:tetratricopeptide (TPR) repeat protein